MAISAIIIGSGPSGIAMAHKLKCELGFEDFIVYDKLDGVGGTWRANSYPGWYVSLSIISGIFPSRGIRCGHGLHEVELVDAMSSQCSTLSAST